MEATQTLQLKEKEIKLMREGHIFLCCPKCKAYSTFSPRYDDSFRLPRRGRESGGRKTQLYECRNCGHQIDFKLRL